jgi:cell division FtsZ-interacting protein ZapD
MSKRKENNQMIERLADALVEEILNASDEEILKEAEEDYGDPKQAVEKTRAIFDKARSLMGKKKLQAARVELTEQQKHSCAIIEIDPSVARSKLDDILKQHPEAGGEFTLAARKGKELSDEDVIGMLEDLHDIGLYNPDDDQG